MMANRYAGRRRECRGRVQAGDSFVGATRPAFAMARGVL
jgi:hypothetical protein